MIEYFVWFLASQYEFNIKRMLLINLYLAIKDCYIMAILPLHGLAATFKIILNYMTSQQIQILKHNPFIFKLKLINDFMK